MNNNLLSWPASPAHPILQNDDVHIWLADLNVSENTLKMLANNLNADEQTRAARFVHQKDSSHYIAARAILRDILSRYTEISSQNIEFNYSEKGKPSLSVEQNQFKIFFNLAHSHGWAIYAITHLNHIGVDIEYTRRNIQALEIAQRFFSKNEIALLKNLPISEQLSGFYKIWTRKEAYVKAIGEGLSHPLDQFSVSLLTGKSPIIFDLMQKNTMQDWHIYDINVMSDFEAAFALQYENPLIQQWYWQVL